MKVKELIEFLQNCDQESTVLTRDYTGGSHPLLHAKAEKFKKGQKITNFDGSWVDEVSKEGTAKTAVVTIRDEER